MSLAFRNDAFEGGYPAELEFKSPSVELIVERLREPGKHQILDLGAPANVNVEFFSQTPCRLWIEDLQRFLSEGRPSQDDDEEIDIAGAVLDALAYDRGARFDLVVGWDLFNYMEPPTIEALVSQVSRSCRRGTLLFLIGFTSTKIPNRPARVTIVANGRLRYTPMGDRFTIGNPRHSPISLEKMMPGFRLLHSFLLGEGLQEYLFTFG